MISAIFNEISAIITSFVDLIVSLFTNVVTIFYTPASGSDPAQLTVVGSLMLIGLATGLVLWGFHYVRSLIRVRTK